MSVRNATALIVWRGRDMRLIDVDPTRAVRRAVDVGVGVGVGVSIVSLLREIGAHWRPHVSDKAAHIVHNYCMLQLCYVMSAKVPQNRNTLAIRIHHVR